MITRPLPSVLFGLLLAALAAAIPYRLSVAGWRIHCAANLAFILNPAFCLPVHCQTENDANQKESGVFRLQFGRVAVGLGLVVTLGDSL